MSRWRRAGAARAVVLGASLWTSLAHAQAAPSPPPPPAPAETSYGAAQARFDLAAAPAPRAPVSVRDEPMVRRGVYDRPYLARIGTQSTDLAIGGYFDLVGSYLQRKGLSDGFSAEARRFNLFVTSRIADRLRLSSEIEFEHGAAEIALETAALDVLLHHAINLRAGIVLVPLGKFNIAHDSPLYDIVDRPLVSTQIIPATFSDVGGGLFGALYPGGHKLTYEVYVVNGLGDGLIGASGTSTAAAKDERRFARDNNGVPAVAARLGYTTPAHPRFRVEGALSFYSGIYNSFKVDGVTVDRARWLHIIAADAEANAGPLTVRGEVAYARTELPEGLTEQHAREQLGVYAEALCTVMKRRLWVLERAALAVAARVDHVDRNRDTRPLTGAALGDETTRLTLGLSLRPAPTTSLRVGYYYEWQTDLLNNLVRAGGVQLGLASYF